MITKKIKKRLIKWVLVFVASNIFLIGSLVIVTALIVGVVSTVNDSQSNCISNTIDVSEGNDSAVPSSIEEFVRGHAEAYMLSWKAGGFLPSASIAQTMVENGFNFTNPAGTSFWQAHNMGGVKTSKLSDFPITLATFGKDSVDITGTKPGTNVGDNTGGAYTWFKNYDAGIVGKAEFMAHQTLYTSAINNTDGISTLTAIYNGGWATDPTYLMKLQSAYKNLGTKFQWLDQEAISKYGPAPYEKKNLSPGLDIDFSKDESTTSEDGCPVSSADTSDQIVGQNSAPILEVPAEYQGKLTLPDPDNHNYSGNNYPYGQCTWGAYNRMAQIGKPIEWFSGDGGNGGSWAASAKARGYTVVKGKPQVGWAVSFPGGVAGSTPPYGHIAVVEYVNEDGSILISETNVINPGSGTRSWRVISKGTVDQVEFIQGGKH